MLRSGVVAVPFRRCCGTVRAVGLSHAGACIGWVGGRGKEHAWKNDAKWGLWGAHPSQTGGFSMVVLTAQPEKLETGSGVAAVETAIGGVKVAQLLRRHVCWVCSVQGRVHGPGSHFLMASSADAC